MQYRFLLLSLALGAAFAAVGCGNSGGTDTGTTTATAASTAGGAAGANQKPLTLAFVTNNASDYWTIARKGTDKAVAEVPNLKVDFIIPGEATAADQTQKINDLLAKGEDGIAVSPVNADNETKLINSAAKKTLLFTQDSDAPKSDRACYIGTDNVAAGRKAGDEIKKALPQGGTIMAFVGDADADNAKMRYQGLQESLKGSNVKIIDLRTDGTDRVRAKANVSDTLVKYPNVAGLVGIWSYNGPAILNAVKDANMIGKVKIVCFDDEPDTISGIKKGAIAATIVQQPFEMGYQSIKNMAAYLRGDKSVVPANKEIFTDTQVIDQAGVDAYTTKMNALLGKK